jgi:hypothetical protein
MRELWRRNALSIVMLGCFFVFWFLQSVAGLSHYNEGQKEHGRPEIGWGEYLGSGEFVEATFENWESEFLQMAAFVFLASKLRQKGSAESDPLDSKPEDPIAERRPDSPGPVHRGGWVLKVYENSLSLVFLALFLFSFALHAVGGLEEANEDALMHGQPAQSLGQFLTDSEFWFQSMQNWQSEFLSIGAMVVLSIWLRQKDSPESKAVAAPHSETGT